MRLLVDLSTLKTAQLSSRTGDVDAPEPWVRTLNGKRGLYLMFYTVLGQRVFREASVSSAAKGN